MEGEYNHAKRSFLTLEEKHEHEKLAHLIDTVRAVKEVFISESHTFAMAIEGDGVKTVDTRFAEGNEAQPATDADTADGMYNLTGETR